MRVSVGLASGKPRAERSAIGLKSRSGRAIIAAVVLGSALAYMSDDMLNVALPTMSRDLGVGVTEMQWVVNGYFVTMLALMLTAGSIGDIRGHRQTFLLGLGVFSIGAISCAVAPGVAILVAGRAGQGVGAAFLIASGLALVNGSFEENERGRAVGLYMGLTALSTAVGPALGGLLVDLMSWRAIFVAPLLFPLAATIVTVKWVPESATGAEHRPDSSGAGLAFVTIASFSVALIRGPGGWLRPEVILATATALVGFVAFVALEKRIKHPMVPLKLFKSRVFSGGNLVTLIAYMVSAGAFFFVIVQLQSGLGWAPSVAGLAFMPLYVVMLVGSPLSGRIADKIGARLPVVAGLGLLAAGVLWLSGIGPESDYLTEVLPGMLTFAVGLSVLGAPLATATLGAVGGEMQGIASGVNNTVGQLGGLLMIAVLPAAAGLSGATFEGAAFADGYLTAMRLCAVLAVTAAFIAALTLGPPPRRFESDQAQR